MMRCSEDVARYSREYLVPQLIEQAERDMKLLARLSALGKGETRVQEKFSRKEALRAD